MIHVYIAVTQDAVGETISESHVEEIRTEVLPEEGSNDPVVFTVEKVVTTSQRATRGSDVSQFLAALGMSFWDTTNPFSPNEENMLPEVQNPTVWCEPEQCWWTHARMPVEHATALQRVWNANRDNPEFTGIIKEVRILWPEYDEEGALTGYSAEEPTWEEPILDEDGNPYMLDIVDEDGNVIGQRAQTWTRRVGDIG